MLVMKFGGTSVGSAEAIKQACGIITAAVPNKPVVIVSAVAGTTNILIELATTTSIKKRLQILQSIKERHATIITDLNLPSTLLDPLFTELENFSKDRVERGAKTTDYLVSFGERLSAEIVAAYLTSTGTAAQAYPAWDIGMITDDRHGRADLLPETPAAIAKAIRAIKNTVPVVTGYIGRTSEGAVTTLGRGGSDYTAAVIGAAIKAERIQIWKEVDGILTADPRIVPEARIVSELAFEEAAELAYFGAKVLHPKTILPAMKANVPVQVLNTFKPDNPGTTIVSTFADRKEKSRSVEAITSKRNVIEVHIYSPEFFDGNGLFAQMVEIFNNHKTSIDVVTTSVASVSVTIDKDTNLPAIVKDLKKLGKVEVDPGKAIICVVGGGVDTAGVAGRMFTVLGENNISVEMISQEASGISMTFVVAEADAEKTVKILHKDFLTK